MSLTWKTRRRLSLLILVVALPVYVVVAVNIVALFERPSPLLELGVYAALGIVWVLPLRGIFRGIGQPEPDDERDEG
ncbi:DUF2842 domain-containing protein [Rhodobacteraceae bacterium WD3A24]|nr:DUF2842 domain-containing protein [Rhodobacteraceae bacterium WD3A24]